MRYEYECGECGVVEEIDCPMGQAPEDLVCALCNEKMYRLFSCNFILKGGDWPGKIVRRERSGECPEATEMIDKMRDQNKSDQALQNEVLAERRKGRAAWGEYQRKHPDKVRRYQENLARGMKGE
jgi:predicted nucleic acid-binding Zn ribbon protein